MKTAYLSLLLATNVMFVSCMEQERPQPIPVYVTNSNPYTVQNQYALQQPMYCEANEPGWEFYDDIANMTYRNNQSTTIHEIPLTPVYKPAKTTIAQQEKKALLQTNSLKPDETIMQELFIQASNFIADSEGIYRSSLQKKTFVNLIKHMNNAKNKNIHEDTVGRFAYKNYFDGIGRHQRTVLFFPILKRYNITVQQTGEQLPLYCSQISCDFDQYPAFFKVLYSVYASRSDIPLAAIELFNDYVYGNQDILLKDYSDGCYKDFKNEFYDKAYDLLLETYTDLNLFHLLQMIDKAKELGDITNEDDLINHMAAFKSLQPIGALLYRILDDSYMPNNINKRIVLFCKLIKNYNNKRGFKITPTVNQYQTYLVKTTLDIPLPENLTNKDLLDDNSYAFTEIKDLQEATLELKKLKVNELYGSQIQQLSFLI